MTATTHANPATSVFPDLAAALHDELEALKKIPREATLFSGEFVGSFAGRFYYRFEIPEHLLLHNPSQVPIQLNLTKVNTATQTADHTVILIQDSPKEVW